MELGKYNTLEIIRETDPGLYLADQEGNEVLLPHKYKPETYKEGDSIEVFVYRDNEARLIATTLKPKAEVGEFAYLRCSQQTNHGAFMEWGIEKDLFVPFKEQARKMNPGSWYTVYIYIDPKTERLVGSSKTKKYLSNENLELNKYDKVDILITHITERGANAIVNGKHDGLIYIENIFEDIRSGDRLPAYVKKIRPDNKIDLLLQPEGYRSIAPNADYLLEELEMAGGFLALTDKSDPEQIKELLGMSKKSFKKALGTLYKARKVKIEEDGISLI
ncbi:GntR family transcriptional regulator [Gilvibacter sp. SZ-19]|jgi:predicted RNA-binding protein (virulence factor B family)|uniref:CvfB family protein n=1 Tax=Gilvibacter sp. SZ-19 TaxID=754429 RepID=UPI000B3CDF28|nr:S1-like domain-containing RNA-binding protein [Gilvibacter sp. SZ-19]ARV10905.1 GntR family transcriptional regulator [Gilvibacter sp. SZ-19]